MRLIFLIQWSAGVSSQKVKRVLVLCVGLISLALLATGCAHYPVNAPLNQVDLNSGYRARGMNLPGKSEKMILLLTFSGGGTRAAALSYGVLEKLRRTEVTLGGKKSRLLDQVDGIASVSGGSFTAGYYGLFGERIFEDFETRFLKKNIEGALAVRTFFDPINWVRLSSPYFGRSDLAAEYYDKYVFDGGTFGDMAARKGPLIVMNATDMISGDRIGFRQEAFDVICSDLSSLPVARAAAASSAVPIVLSPITIRNYAGRCGFKLPPQMEKTLEGPETSTRKFYAARNFSLYLDAEKRPFIHLVDGGVSDNLGVRAALDAVLALGDIWSALQFNKREDVEKIVLVVVNAEKKISGERYLSGKVPSLGATMDSFSTVMIERYNYDTLMLLRDSFRRWTEEIQQNRCGNRPISTEPGGCGDIKFYFVEVKFDALKDESERAYLNALPTSFKLSSKEVDRLLAAARRILVESDEFQRLLHDLKE
jgi:NTE family protein